MAAVYWEEIMNLAILPLAITMLAGPQIMSAIIFITSTRPVRTSAAFIIGVAIAATVGVFIGLPAWLSIPVWFLLLGRDLGKS
jgi:small neutral amino acid transporter SnatA (MarC family)